MLRKWRSQTDLATIVGLSPGRCIPKAVTLPVAKSVWASACSAIAKVGTYGRECGPESKSAMRTGLSVAGKGRNP